MEGGGGGVKGGGTKFEAEFSTETRAADSLARYVLLTSI